MYVGLRRKKDRTQRAKIKIEISKQNDPAVIKSIATVGTYFSPLLGALILHIDCPISVLLFSQRTYDV